MLYNWVKCMNLHSSAFQKKAAQRSALFGSKNQSGGFATITERQVGTDWVTTFMHSG